MFAEQRLFAGRAEFVEISAHAQRDFFGVENLAGVGGGAVLGATSAFDAGVGLQRDELGDVFAGIEAEIFVAHQRRNFAEGVALQKDGQRAQHQVQMLGVRDQRQENEKRERVRPPKRSALLAARQEGQQIGDHQQEDQQRDEAGFVRHRAEPFRPDHQAAERQARDGDRHGDGENRGQREVDSAEHAVAGEQLDMHALGEMVDGDEREGAEAPEHERVRESGQRALADHFALQQNFPDEVADAPAHGLNAELGILLGSEHGAPDFSESQPEAGSRRHDQDQKQRRFRPRELNHKLRV